MRETQFISHDSAAIHPDRGKPNPGTFEDLPAASKSTLGGGPVSKKISHLVHEGKPQKQAVAMALSMKRAGRLTASGGYRYGKD